LPAFQLEEAAPGWREALALWGARAIFHPGSADPIDLVWDRKDQAGDDHDVRDLCTWLDTTGLPAMRRRLAQLGTRTMDGGPVYVRDITRLGSGSCPGRSLVLVADPRRSGGYLYLTALMLDDDGADYGARATREQRVGGAV
jgi:hypothetical protein